MSDVTLAAHTTADNAVFPAYFNARVDGVEVVLTVRGKQSGEGQGLTCGPTAEIRVCMATWRDLLATMGRETERLHAPLA